MVYSKALDDPTARLKSKADIFVTPRNNCVRRKAAIQKTRVATLTIYTALL